MAFHKISSLCFSNGSKLYLIEPENNTGSWGMMEILDLRSLNPTLLMSTPSMVIVPSIGVSLNIDAIMDDFPAPVRPTIPI